jgi:hypothetical protein
MTSLGRDSLPRIEVSREVPRRGAPISRRWAMKRALLMVAALLLLPASAALADESGFRYFGSAGKSSDPQNPANDVVRIQTSASPPVAGGVSRRLGDKVPDLDNQLSVKYFMQAGTCQLGSPRYQLAIDTDGDGNSNGNAFGYLGLTPSFICPTATNNWEYEDLTDADLEWDITQFGGPFYNTWDQVEAFFVAFPNHKVLRGALVQDPYDMTAFYDNITIGNGTLSDPKHGPS